MLLRKHLYIFSITVFVFNACTSGSTEEEKPLKGFDHVAPVPEAEQEPASPEGDYYFSGLINHKYAIHLHLQVNHSEVTGEYYYHSQKKELGLRGTVNGPNLEMDEFIKEKITGHFNGTTYGTDSVVGTWTSPKGKTLDFVLYHSVKDSYEKYLKEQAPVMYDLAALKNFRKKFKTVSFPFEYEALDEEQGEGFTEAEIKTYAMEEYDPEDYWGYRYYYGLSFETENYIALIYTEDYSPGAFGIHNQSLVMVTISKTGELIDRAYLGCHCMDTNMGANDYYATDDRFFFTEGNIRVESKNTHATLIENGGEDGAEPFEDISESTRNISIGTDGKIGNTGY